MPVISGASKVIALRGLGARLPPMGEKTLVFTHVPFEGTGYLGEWAGSRGAVQNFPLYETGVPPYSGNFETLIIMGGPMGVSDADKIPWMRMEFAFVERAIADGRRVIGVCLGAQIIAHVLGAKVSQNPHKEIGWFDIEISGQSQVSERLPALASHPAIVKVFHWHGETFSVPDGALLFARSAACVNQGFVYGGNVLALQFHAEATVQTVADLLENCAEDLTPGPFVQSPEEIRRVPTSSERFLVLEALLNGTTTVHSH